MKPLLLSLRERLRPVFRPLLVTVGVLALLAGVDLLILWLNGLVSFSRPSEYLAAVSLSRDGKKGAAICRRGGDEGQPMAMRIVAFDSTLRPPLRDLPCSESLPTAIARCSLSERIFVGCDDGSLLLYEARDPLAPPVLVGRHVSVGSKLRTPRVEQIVLSDDERILATHGGLNVVLWDLAQRRQLQLEREGKHLTCAAFLDPDSLLTGTLDGEVLLWCTATGRQLRRLAAHTSGIESVAAPPTGNLLAATAEDRLVHVWDVETGARRWSHSIFWPRAAQMAFTTDGRTLAISGGVDVEDLLIFDAETGELRLFLSACPARINSLVYAEAGSLIACDDEGTVWSWDATGTERRWRFGSFSAPRRDP